MFTHIQYNYVTNWFAILSHPAIHVEDTMPDKFPLALLLFHHPVQPPPCFLPPSFFTIIALTLRDRPFHLVHYVCEREISLSCFALTPSWGDPILSSPESCC